MCRSTVDIQSATDRIRREKKEDRKKQGKNIMSAYAMQGGHKNAKPKQTDRHPFNGLFSRTTRVSRHQKGQTILDFNEGRDDEMAVASAGRHANHSHLSPDITTPARHKSNFFYMSHALPDAQPTVSKALKNCSYVCK